MAVILKDKSKEQRIVVQMYNAAYPLQKTEVKNTNDTLASIEHLE